MKLPLDMLVDAFDLPMPNRMKIDVDGSESEVLAGARTVLQSDRLEEIFVEVYEPSEDENRIVATLEQHGFRVRARVGVAHHAGGVYKGLFNIILER